MIYLFYIATLVIIGLLFYADWPAMEQKGLIQIGREVWPSLLTVIIFAILQELATQRHARAAHNALRADIRQLPQSISDSITKRWIGPDSFGAIVDSIAYDRIGNHELASSLGLTLRRILADSRILANLEVRLEIACGTLPGDCSLKVTETFDASDLKDRFVVAISNEGTLLSRLANYAARVDKVYDPWEPVNEGQLGSAVCDINFMVHVQGRSPVPVMPRLASPSEKDDLLSDVTITEEEKTRITVAIFDYETIGYKATAALSFSARMHLRDGYCYWSTDRLAHVRNISVDYRDVKEKMGNVSVIEFCATPGMRIDFDRSRALYRAECNEWLLPGQGILVRWNLLGE